MEVRRLLTFIAPVVIASMVLCGFFVSSQTSCLSSPESGALVGVSCTAEATSAPTVWSWREGHLAVRAKELALILITATLLGVLMTRRKPDKHDPSGAQWMRFMHPHILGLRSGPTTVFIPSVHATHGW